MATIQGQNTVDSLRTLRQRAETALHPIMIIVRREVRDTLRDWRIVFPVLLLITIFPFLANFAAQRGLLYVNQYGAKLIMERLFPFLMLVVGFFPSSFSLVIALESFVGEKERRSLEPLLSTPLADTQLYLGKLLSSTFTPVVASYIGMVFYMLLLGFSIGWWPSFSLLMVAFALSTTQALVMVSAAVVISSQATSARAANLLASFIVVPMAFLLQGEAGLLLVGNYTGLWLIALFLLVVNILFIRMGIRVFNREYLLGREIDVIDFRGGWRTFKEAFWPKGGFRELYLREIPSHIRLLLPEILFTVLVVFGGGAAVGLWGSANFPLPESLIQLPESLSMEDFEVAVRESGLLSEFSTWAILGNNVRSLLLAGLLALFSMGTLAELLLMTPIALIAYVFMEIPKAGMDPWGLLATFVLPHGIFELPAAVIATAQAMRVGVTILRSPEDGGGVMGMVREAAHFFKLFLAVVLPLLLLAAWVEAEITPRLVIAFLAEIAAK